MKIINAKVFTPDFQFKAQDLYIKGQYLSDPYADHEIFDAKGLMAVPGLIDTHFHGAVNADFMDVTPQSLSAIAAYEAAHGITSICPASMTMSASAIAAACRNAANFKPKDHEASLLGIYLEGPFIAAARAGAQDPDLVLKPDLQLFEQWQTLSHNLIKVLALAPEVAPAVEVIQALSSQLAISIAHTNCTYDEAAAALAAGASRITHLYNAMPGIHHRAPGPILAAMDDEKTMAELICDGIHIHAAAVRAAFKLFGPERMILISDSMRATGLSDGIYDLGGQSVQVQGRRASLPDGTLAGSVSNLYTCMRNAVLHQGIRLNDAVRAATYNPAKSINVLHQAGILLPGRLADILLIDDQLNLKAVLLRGKWIKRSLED